MNPIAWVKPFEHDYYEGKDPGVGRWTLSRVGEDSREPFKLNFSPAIPAGENIVTIMDRLNEMKRPDGSHYRDYAYQHVSAMIGLGRDHHGYVYGIEEGKRLIELARTRPEVGEMDEMILAAGFKFAHYMPQAVVKAYRKKIPYGTLSCYRGINHVHMIFERTTANSWTNVFRYNRFITAQNDDLWPLIWPDYLDSMRIATYLALDTVRQFEEDELNRRRAYKPK